MDSVPRNRDNKLEALYNVLLGMADHGLCHLQSGHSCPRLSVESLVAFTFWLVNQIVLVWVDYNGCENALEKLKILFTVATPPGLCFLLIS